MDDECMICLEPIHKFDIAILNCKHILHYKCLQEWCDKKQNYTKLCPICDIENEIKNIVTVDKKFIAPRPLRQSEPEYESTPKPFLWCCQIL